MRWVVLVALCSCNRLLGLDDVRDRTPLIDAPFACPPIGTTPVFSLVLHQSVNQFCNDYSRSSTGWAVGTCRSDPNYNNLTISEGVGDDALAPITMFETSLGTLEEFVQPRETSDGTVLLVKHTLPSGMVRVEQYVRAGTAWTYDRDIPIPLGAGQSVELGHIAGAATDRRMITIAAAYEEWGTASGIWSSVATHSVAALGLATIVYAALTEDGLRMLVVGTVAGGDSAVYYTDRPDLASEFRAADLLDNVPTTSAPFLDQTCARIYLTGLDWVFYAQQQ